MKQFISTKLLLSLQEASQRGIDADANVLVIELADITEVLKKK